MISTFPRNPQRDYCYDFQPGSSHPEWINLGEQVAGYMALTPPETAEHPFPTDVLSKAIATWRAFLLGAAPHPGAFEQHLFIFGATPDTARAGLSPFFNRYALRSVGIDLLRSSTQAFVFSKVCQFMFFGVVQAPEIREWQGTKLHVKSGTLSALTTYAIPRTILEFLSAQAERVGASLASLSERQSQRLNEHLWSNLDKLRGSEVIRAMESDVEGFGQDAFRITKRGEPGDPEA